MGRAKDGQRQRLAASICSVADRSTSASLLYRRRYGLTLVELLVCLAIIALLLALTTAAVQGARETARRAACAANLRQLGVAITAHESARGVFPPGAWWVGQANKSGFSLHVALLPYLERNDLFEKIDGSESAEDGNDALRASLLSVFVCPTDAASAQPLADPSGGSPPRSAGTHYAGNFGTGVQKYGYNGMFHHVTNPPTVEKPKLGPGHVIDGLSNTAAMAEILVSDGTTSFLRLNWNTPSAIRDFDAFVQASLALSPNDVARGAARGRPWTHGEAGWTLYNHVLPPNRVSCRNGAAVQTGAYTATSLHRKGVNVLLADGHVKYIGDAIDQGVWRAYGSRNGRDLVE